MQIEVIGRDYEITKSIQDIVESKIGFIKDFTDEKVLVVISKDGNLNEIRVASKMYGQPIDIVERHEDFYEGIDLLKDKLFNKITKRKEIAVDKRRKETRAMKRMKNIPVKNVQEESKVYVRRKTVPLKPMLVEEAALQMNMLGFRFFVFLNGETMENNIIYIHYDEKYRLLELKPEHEHSSSEAQKTSVPAFISKAKSVPVYPMTRDEALEELKENDFPFYPYFDIDKDTIGVICEERKKKEGYCSITITLD